MEEHCYSMLDLLEDLKYEQMSTYCMMGHKICFDRFNPTSNKCLGCLGLELKDERGKEDEQATEEAS